MTVGIFHEEGQFVVLFLYFPDDYGKKCIDHLGIERKRVFLGEKCNLKKTES